MVNKSRRIKDTHEEVETQLLRVKFEEVYLRERLKQNEKEFDRLSKKLFKIVKENNHG